ncbi:MAG: hypothetical protein DMD65_02265 [Gemmatimonadetes bacterium]|nr:MAG: hypothetical protein DMD65_02265 [Gemmatimonadota bacterium]
MPLLGILGASGEGAQLHVGIAASHILDDGGDQRLVAEVLVADVTEDADPHGSFCASASRV